MVLKSRYHKVSLWPRVPHQRVLTTCYFRVDSSLVTINSLLGGPPKKHKKFVHSCSLPWPALDVKWSYLGLPF